jgi:hypothetical protein
MKTRSSGIRWALLTALVGGFAAGTEAKAQKGHGGHSGGHAMHAPHVSAPRQQAYKPPRMPNVMAPAWNNTMPRRSGSTHAQAQARHHRTQASKAMAHANSGATVAGKGNASAVGNAATHAGRAIPTTSLATGTASSPASGTTGRNMGPAALSPGTMASIGAGRGLSGSTSPFSYTYGNGANARSYRPYGYGYGYRNRYNRTGYGYGYGRSQGLNRAIVARLRSVHAALSRIDHDYAGHRVQAMHAISMAIRQLSHQSMGLRGAGFAPGMNRAAGAGMGMGMGMRRSMLAGAGRGGQRMPQAQSDAIMGHSLRALQGIDMQLANQGSFNMGHARARGYVEHAIQRLNVALSIR